MNRELVNPFRPSAGAEPPVLIGRDRVLNDFAQGLREGVGAPARLMRITGPRGSGKTVLLTELGDMARKRGWCVVDVTASEGLVVDIAHALAKREGSTTFEGGVNLGVASARMSRAYSEDAVTLRDVLTDTASELTKRGTGLLVTVDEIQDAAEEDVRLIAASVQHLIRERMNISFVFAGITTGVMDLINGRALTFLRRAKAEELAAIPLDEVALALRASIEQSGLQVAPEALDYAADATKGYAFLVQLVGYHVWREGASHAGISTLLTQNDAKIGVREALREFNNTVHESAISDLPLRAVEYLLAMADGPVVVATKDVAERLGAPASSLTSYRRLLIKRQVIEPTARGYVKFSIPYIREFLLENREELLARYGVETDC